MIVPVQVSDDAGGGGQGRGRKWGQVRVQAA